MKITNSMHCKSRFIIGVHSHCGPDGVKYAFSGQYNDENKPDGIVRLIDAEGNVYEGNMEPSGEKHGFGIFYTSKKLQAAEKIETKDGRGSFKKLPSAKDKKK